MEPDPEIEALLRASRPEPDWAWVRTTGETLFDRRRARFDWATVRLGSAFAGGLAAVALALSLGGVGPLAGTESDVEARDDCRTVTLTRTAKLPSVIATKDGGIRIVTQSRPVERTVERCD